jgi:hypothetical protein
VSTSAWLSARLKSQEDTITYIDLGTVHPVDGRPHFRGCIGSSANTLRQIVCFKSISTSPVQCELSARSQTEVPDLDVIHPVGTAADKDVLRFQVAVDNTQAVNVSQTLKDLSKETPYLGRILVETPADEISQCLKK